jgi:hypothetical protein
VTKQLDVFVTGRNRLHGYSADFDAFGPGPGHDRTDRWVSGQRVENPPPKGHICIVDVPGIRDAVP